MNRALVGVFALALLAASPSPGVVAGSVRDQHGAPIAGARITIFSGPRSVGRAVTAPDGTFAFGGSGSSVEIACRFCRTQRVPVDEDGIATAVVTRYDALAVDGPSPDDLTHLPYATPAQLLALEPFVVVNETSRTVPGVSATDRNSTPYGGLVVIDGAPDYDVNAAITPLDTVAQGGVSQIDIARVDRAYRYGNTAQGGTFAFETSGGESDAGAGGITVARIATAGSSGQAAVSLSDAAIGARALRAAADVGVATRSLIGELQLSAGGGYDAPGAASALFSSFSSATAQIRTRGPIDAFTRITADRGTYDYTSLKAAQAAQWSDLDVEAGVTSHATLAPFALLQVRQSAGSYVSRLTGSDGLAGVLSQARVTGGVAYHTDLLDAFAAFGNDSIGYAGISGGASRDAESASDGVISATWHPSASWSLHASTSSGYTLAPLIDAYQNTLSPLTYVAPVSFGHANEALLEYNDSSRLRVGATALAWGADNNASTSSAGLSIAWQIAPKLSLRTWLLSESSSAWARGTVGTAWLTYENGDAFRADLYAGRSLVDRLPENAVNLSFSGRLSDRLDWFVSSSNLFRSQAGTAGVRIR